MKTISTLCIIVFVFILSKSSLAQEGISINTDGSSPHVSAMLDVKAIDKGLLVPRMTEAQRVAIISPAAGLLVYQTNNSIGFWYHDGTSWFRLPSENENWKIMGNTGTNPAINFVGTTNNTDFVTRTNNLERMRILANGNIGVGTSTPGSRLDVQGGNLTVGAVYDNTNIIFGRIGSFDTRNADSVPQRYSRGLVSEFKNNAVNGLSDGGTYNSVLSLRQWGSASDWSGGGVHQLGFTTNGNLWHRYSQTNDVWGVWRKYLHSGDINGTANYVAKFTGTNTIGNSQVFDNGTNVGIGTNDPQGAKLRIHGGSLGSVMGDELLIQQLYSANTNNQYLRFFTRRSTAGSGWGTADLFIQRRIDASDMGFIKWSAGDWGIELGSGISTHLKVHQSGNVQINNLTGTGTRPVYSDANGVLTSQGRVYSSKTAASANLTTGIIEAFVTDPITVVSGELIRVNAAIELRNVSGSGNDRWRIIMEVSGCGNTTYTEYSRTITATPFNNHGVYNYYPYVDMWVAECSGNVTFRFRIERFDSDDSWNHRNIRVLLTKE